jgi:hypothetical protein
VRIRDDADIPVGEGVPRIVCRLFVAVAESMPSAHDWANDSGPGFCRRQVKLHGRQRSAKTCRSAKVFACAKM